MPEYHRRHTEQVTYKYTSQTKMTKEDKRIIISFFYSIVVSVTDITMLCKNFIKFTGYLIIIIFHVGFLHSFILKPAIILIKTLILCPVLRQPVPCTDFAVRHIRSMDQYIKLTKPVAFCCCAVHFFQCTRSCILRTSHSRNIKIFDVKF